MPIKRMPIKINSNNCFIFLKNDGFWDIQDSRYYYYETLLKMEAVHVLFSSPAGSFSSLLF